MTQAQSGDDVKIHYTGRLADGTVFDSSSGRDPLAFTLGSGQVIPGFDDAVTGMTPGERRTATIPAAQAYGPRNEDLLLTVPRDRLPAELDVEVGQQLQMQTQDGRAVPVTVAETRDETVLLDANHPLAGKDLTFEIELVEIG